MTLKSSAVGSKDAGYLQGMFQDLEAAEALRCVCWLGDLVRKRVHVERHRQRVPLLLTQIAAAHACHRVPRCPPFARACS